MNSILTLVAAKVRVFGVQLCVSYCCLAFFSVHFVAQDAARNVQIHSEIKHIGSAEVREVAPGSPFDPQHQPQVYWHDGDWDVDLLIPTPDVERYRLSIGSSSKNSAIIELPKAYEQVNSVLRSPGDKAIVIEESHTGSGAFAIVDLNTGQLIDNIGMGFEFISPNRRFILYQNWYPNEATAYENMYRLYDTLKSPRENVCGYRDNDPKHESLDDGMRGFQVYPRKPGPLTCAGPEDDDDDNMGTNFTWAPDSSKLVFADIKGGVMSLIMVMMPVGIKDQPKTLVYPLKGIEDVCAGATNAAGGSDCDYHVIQSIDWEGDVVKALFHHQFGTKFDLQLLIPISKFAPIE
jgi:hypothetical protein